MAYQAREYISLKHIRLNACCSYGNGLLQHGTIQNTYPMHYGIHQISDSVLCLNVSIFH